MDVIGLYKQCLFGESYCGLQLAFSEEKQTEQFRKVCWPFSQSRGEVKSGTS